MANPKIQLTYLWTDEAVMRDDLMLKVSRDMADWATKFFARFQFDVDVQPAANVRSAVSQASKYALRKNDGIKPSLSTTGASDKDKALLNKLNLESISKEIDANNAGLKVVEVRDALKAHIAAAKALEAKSTAGMSLPEIQAYTEELKASGAESDRLGALFTARWDEYNRVKAESDKAKKALRSQERKVEAQTNVVRSDVAMRTQMSEKFKKEGIGDGHRLNVVFTRFQLDRTEKSPVRSKTYLSHSDPVLDLGTRMIIWPYTYVIIDVSAQVSSLAYEIVRAAGHVPPDARRVFTGMEKTLRLKQPLGVIGGPSKSIFDPDAWEYEVPQFEEVAGGFLDGPENDIMNAGRDDTDPDSINLSEPDKRMLSAAPFVTT